MIDIFINSNLLNYSSIESYGLIEGLKELSSKDFIIYTEVKDIFPNMISIFETEKIAIQNADTNMIELNIEFTPNKGIVYNNNYYSNFNEVAKFITKKNRTTEVIRNTKETKISVKIDLDGEGQANIKTGIGFFDHMLEQIGRHANFDMEINVDGDLNVDEHHTVEDCGLALGEAIKKALGNKAGIKRYGYFLPMDDSIAKCAVDFGGRSYLNFKCKFNREKVGDFPTELTEEFFKSIAAGMSSTIYLRAKGKNDHHKIECMFKAFAKSLNEAARIDDRVKNKLPSTKGVL
ncbi:MAG: imidazoleglycerol-phosphate dehydratase HisB [bacterium]